MWFMLNNDYPNFVFSGYLKEYSIVGNYLKEKSIIKNKMSDGSIVCPGGSAH